MQRDHQAATGTPTPNPAGKGGFAIDEFLPKDDPCSVLGALIRVHSEKRAEARRLAIALPSAADKRDSEKKILSLFKEMAKLFSWIAPVGKPSSAMEEQARMMLIKQFSLDIVRPAVKAPKPRGRFAGRGRPAAIIAKEKRLTDRKAWSWSKLARRYCRCDREDHNIICQAALRIQVRKLEKLLKKYQIKVPRPSVTSP